MNGKNFVVSFGQPCDASLKVFYTSAGWEENDAFFCRLQKLDKHSQFVLRFADDCEIILQWRRSWKSRAFFVLYRDQDGIT